MHRPVVLFVDDDERILHAWRRAFANEPYECLWAKNLSAARRILNTSPVSAVVTDYAMPQGNGLELLREIAELQPSTVRIMVSGHANLSVAQEAINKCGIHLFFQKPCSVVDLGSAVRELLKRDPDETSNAELISLERQHPGITWVEKDAEGRIKL